MTITVYSKPGCVQCTAAKRKLAAIGADFIEVDLTQSPENAARLSSLGFRGLPVIERGNDHVVGYNADAIVALFKGGE